jgi:hypothetical protein
VLLRNGLYAPFQQNRRKDLEMCTLCPIIYYKSSPKEMPCNSCTK